jgi:hypothetical protein
MMLHDTVSSHASVSVLFGVSADGMPKSETGVSSLPLRIVGTVSDIPPYRSQRSLPKPRRGKSRPPLKNVLWVAARVELDTLASLSPKSATFRSSGSRAIGHVPQRAHQCVHAASFVGHMHCSILSGTALPNFG